MHASTSRDAGSSKPSGTKPNSVSLRKRTRGNHGANGVAHSSHRSERPLTRQNEQEFTEQLSPISGSSQEYGFERDGTVDTSLDEQEEEDDNKTPTGVEPRSNGFAGRAPVDEVHHVPAKKNRSRRKSTGSYEPASPLTPTRASKSWYEFDLAVVIALVSPMGNYLTGGDHVKKLLLAILVVYYLHQIIEMPWDLYHKARPRTRGLPPAVASESDRFNHLAQGELRRMENFCLLLAIASPLVGAVLLRYATSEILGEDAISWFSTGLFVLSTGMRPWKHLIDRLHQRTGELQDFIHYPELYDKEKGDAEASLRQALTDVDERLQKLERKMRKAKRELLDINDDMVEYVDGAGKKQEKRYDKYEMRLKALESTIHDLQTRGMRSRRNSINYEPAPFLVRLKHSFEDAIRWVLEATYPTSSASPGCRSKGAPLATIQEEEDVVTVAAEPKTAPRPPSSPRPTLYRILGLVFLPAKAVVVISSSVFRLVTFPVRVAYRMVS